MKAINPRGPSEGEYRIDRGACWDNSAGTLVVSYRDSSVPGYHDYYIGLRIVCNARKR